MEKKKIFFQAIVLALTLTYKRFVATTLLSYFFSLRTVAYPSMKLTLGVLLSISPLFWGFNEVIWEKNCVQCDVLSERAGSYLGEIYHKLVTCWLLWMSLLAGGVCTLMHIRRWENIMWQNGWVRYVFQGYFILCQRRYNQIHWPHERKNEFSLGLKNFISSFGFQYIWLVLWDV